MNKLDVLSTLKEHSSEFTQRMMSHIYPTLAGTDMRGLAYFFSLLETYENKVLCGLTPADHAALLRKLKPACPGDSNYDICHVFIKLYMLLCHCFSGQLEKVASILRCRPSNHRLISQAGGINSTNLKLVPR